MCMKIVVGWEADADADTDGDRVVAAQPGVVCVVVRRQLAAERTEAAMARMPGGQGG